MGLTKEQQEIIDALPSGTAKNAALHKTLLSNASAGELPSAQMASLFAKAAEQRIMEEYELDVSDEDELAQIRSLAAQLGLKAAQEAKVSGDIEQGFMLIGTHKKGDDILSAEAVPASSGETASMQAVDSFIKEKEK